MDLENQLRQAEIRLGDLRRQHQDAINSPRHSNHEPLDARQSRIRELEKKVALETVRCEELQLELSSQRKQIGGMQESNNTVASVTVPSQWSQSLATSPGQSVKGTEIERIMAKIEQDNRILAELEHSRSTTLGAGAALCSSASSHALGESSPPISPITMSHTTPAICYPGGSSGVSSFHLPSSLTTSSAPFQYTSLGYTPKPTSIITNTSSQINPTLGSSMGGYSLGTHTHSLLPNSYTLGYNPTGTNTFSNNVTFSSPLLTGTNFSSLSGPTAMSIKLKPLEESELGGVRRVATPCTPHQPVWNQSESVRPLSRLITDGLDHTTDWGALHGLNGLSGSDGQVDMLDIPGKGRCSVYMARFSYEPDVEAAEDELCVSAGDYLLVWGEPTNGIAGSYLDAELLDGRRGLVPSHFCTRLIGEDLLDFHQAVLSTLRDEDQITDTYVADLQRLSELAGLGDGQEDDTPDADTVPAPRHLTLERQLNKSVLIGWTAPETTGPGNHIDSYHVYVDGVLKTTVKATERTRALVEGVDSNRPHRISVRSVTTNRRTSRDAACTMLIGRDTHLLGPTAVRATNVTSSQAVISWLPANSNHQHVVCVNNVEVRTVKPGVYRHTITGLAPNTQYRVTVRAKHLRAQQHLGASGTGPGSVDDPLLPAPVAASAHTDFRTLPKGLPDPPGDIQVEPGPQDGTLLVTWHPVHITHHPSSVVTGYAVYADGKKVTDVDSPTGDHALIDITKLLGLNPRHVTVRTKSRDSQSADSPPTPIPAAVLRGGSINRPRGPRNVQQQRVIEHHDDNLSDKEIFPGQRGVGSGAPGAGGLGVVSGVYGDPQHRGVLRTNVTDVNKDLSSDVPMSEDDYSDMRRNRQQITTGVGLAPQPQPSPRTAHHDRQIQQQQQQQIQQQQQQIQQQQQLQQQQQQLQTQQRIQAQQNPNTQLSGARRTATNVGGPGQRPQPGPAQKRPRYFVALFDYDPSTMSPNPDACEEELPFSEGDTIKVWGDKDADGFFWGECRGRRGFVPHNMVMEVESRGEGNAPSNRGDRWGDIYANMPVKRMVALYDYDPQELSPNVDAEQVELSFTTGSIIHVYGDMDDDGFFMGELDGVRGLVPSNFLAEAPDQYSGAPGGPQRAQRGRGHGPGARGPPPPPRDGAAARSRNKDPCVPTQVVPCSQQQQQQQHLVADTYNNTTSLPTTSQQHQQQLATSNNMTLQHNNNNMMDLHSAGMQQGQRQQRGVAGLQSVGPQGAQLQQNAARGRPGNQGGFMKGIPAVIPTPMQQQQQQQIPSQGPAVGVQGQPQTPAGPNLMQKFTEMAAPGGDILSKGKELIFMKFGLGGGK